MAPSVSQHQSAFFHKCLNDPKFARLHGVSKEVAQEFVDADKGKNIKKLPVKIKPKKK